MKNSPSSPPHLLLIDDNHDGLLVRRSLLEEAGCSVAVAHSGEEGLDLFARRNYDLTVTDYRMPGGIDGIEVIRRVRAADPAARVILLSGFVEPLGLTEENTGADAVVAKTSREAMHLVRAVKRLLNRPARKPPARQQGTGSLASAKSAAAR